MQHVMELGVLPQSAFTNTIVCCSREYSSVTTVCVVAQHVVSSLRMCFGSNEELQPVCTPVQPSYAMCTAIVHI